MTWWCLGGGLSWAALGLQACLLCLSWVQYQPSPHTHDMCRVWGKGWLILANTNTTRFQTTTALVVHIMVGGNFTPLTSLLQKMWLFWLLTTVVTCQSTLEIWPTVEYQKRRINKTRVFAAQYFLIRLSISIAFTFENKDHKPLLHLLLYSCTIFCIILSAFAFVCRISGRCPTFSS